VHNGKVGSMIYEVHADSKQGEKTKGVRSHGMSVVINDRWCGYANETYGSSGESVQHFLAPQGEICQNKR